LHLSPEDISCAVTGTDMSCDTVEVTA
jgi:hypothetical protein